MNTSHNYIKDHRTIFVDDQIDVHKHEIGKILSPLELEEQVKVLISLMQSEKISFSLKFLIINLPDENKIELCSNLLESIPAKSKRLESYVPVILFVLRLSKPEGMIKLFNEVNNRYTNNNYPLLSFSYSSKLEDLEPFKKYVLEQINESNRHFIPKITRTLLKHWFDESYPKIKNILDMTNDLDYIVNQLESITQFFHSKNKELALSDEMSRELAPLLKKLSTYGITEKRELHNLDYFIVSLSNSVTSDVVDFLLNRTKEGCKKEESYLGSINRDFFMLLERFGKQNESLRKINLKMIIDQLIDEIEPKTCLAYGFRDTFRNLAWIGSVGNFMVEGVGADVIMEKLEEISQIRPQKIKIDKLYNATELLRWTQRNEAFFRTSCKIIDISHGDRRIFSNLLSIAITGMASSSEFQRIRNILSEMLSEEQSGFSKRFLKQLIEYFEERGNEEWFDGG